ncbi:MAG: hypothetical protein ACLP9L_06790 [Thermoguttaceae bacterium]
MFELTSAQYRFRRALPEGDLYEALGLSPKATSLDVDVAGARLAEQMPSMAQDVSRVVNVLTHRQRKALYDVVRKVRDEVADLLASRYGPDFSHSIPDFRRDLWERCSRLFCFDLAGDEQKLGENGRQALARVAPEWIVRGLLDAHVTKFAFESRKGQGSRAWRDEWHARCRCPRATSLLFTPRVLPTPQDGHQSDPPEEFSDADYWEKPPTCPRCRERYRPIEFGDCYVFVLPARLARGEVLRGESVAGGSPTFVVVGSPTGLEAPKALLERFFALQNEGKDVTLANAERDLRKRPPVVPKRSRPSQPSPPGRFPTWPMLLAMIVISNLLRTCSQNDSHWPTPTLQSTPPKLKLPESPPYPQIPPPQWPRHNSSTQTVPPNWTVPGYDFPPKPSASPPRANGVQ